MFVAVSLNENFQLTCLLHLLKGVRALWDFTLDRGYHSACAGTYISPFKELCPVYKKEEGGLLSRPLLFQDVFPLSVNDKLFNNLVFVVHDDNGIHATADRT